MKKKAEDLKPGDVVVTSSSRIIIVENDPRGILWGVRDGFAGEGVRSFNFQREVDVVESPSLTPAKEHAEELLRLIKVAQGVEGFRLPPDDAIALRDVLAKIDPPKPPTAEELAKALLSLRQLSTASGSQADAILERARAAGMLAARAEVKE